MYGRLQQRQLIDQVVRNAVHDSEAGVRLPYSAGGRLGAASHPPLAQTATSWHRRRAQHCVA